MVARYSRKWAYWLTGLGIVCVMLYFVGARGWGYLGVVVAGAACLIVGAGYAFRPYFTVEKGRIVVHALLSPLKKTYEFGDGDLSLQGDQVWVYSGKAWRRVRISRSMIAADDWTAFLRSVGLASTTGLTDSFDAPMWRFRLIGLDRYDHSFFTYGDYETFEEAEAEAVRRARESSMEEFYIHDDQGKRLKTIS